MGEGRKQFYFLNLQTYLGAHVSAFTHMLFFSIKQGPGGYLLLCPILPQHFVNRCDPGSMNTQGQRVSSMRELCRKGQGLFTHPALVIAGECAEPQCHLLFEKSAGRVVSGSGHGSLQPGQQERCPRTHSYRGLFHSA